MTTKPAEPKAKQTAATGTVRLHRVFKAPPERIYKAVLDPATNCKWLSPHGYTCTVHHLDAKVGGTYKMSFTNFSSGKSHSFGGKYLELKPGERIVATDAFDDPNPPGEMRTTYTLRKVSVGTEVNIVQKNIPAAIPPEACYLGWQESLEQLASSSNPRLQMRMDEALAVMSEREAKLKAILRIGHETSIRGAGISLRVALARSGYRELRPTFEPADLVPLIREDSALCERWLAYSQDKRTSSGWYLLEDGGVGRLEPEVAPQRFGSKEEALALFVVRELDFCAGIGHAD